MPAYGGPFFGLVVGAPPARPRRLVSPGSFTVEIFAQIEPVRAILGEFLDSERVTG